MKSQAQREQATVVFTCWNKKVNYKDQLNVQWYKDDVILIPNQRIMMQDKFLFILNASKLDTASYSCKVQFKRTTFERTSKSLLLNITGGWFFINLLLYSESSFSYHCWHIIQTLSIKCTLGKDLAENLTS